MENKFEQNLNKPKLEQPRNFSLHTPKKTIEIVGELKGALASKDESTVRSVLEDFKNRESLRIRKGEGKENLRLLKEGFTFLAYKEFGGREGFLEAKGVDIIKWIHETDLPEGLLPDMMAVLSNAREDSLLFLKLFGTVEENSDLLKNENILYEAEHVLASWERELNNNKYSAQNTNKKVIINSTDPFVLAKARFGVAYNKPFKQIKDKAEEFEKISLIMEEIGDQHDSAQALAVAGEAYLSLANRQKLINSREAKSLAEANFEKAKALIDEAFKKAKEIDYPNAKIRAMKAFIKLFEALGYSKKAKGWKKDLGKIEEKVN